MASSRAISGVGVGVGSGAGSRLGLAAGAPAGLRPAPIASPRLRAPARPSGRLGAAAEMHIGALRLSLPGVGAPVGRRVAERVSALLAERWPAGLAGRQGHIERLELKVRPRAPGEDALSESIAQALLEAIGRT